MPVMSGIEAAFCRSAPWRGFARRVVLPWAVGDTALRGDVLEAGGGSGAMAEALLRAGPELHLTVVDTDPSMVAAASKRLAALRERSTVEQADLLELPYEDQRFDAVASFLMLHHVINWPDALKEIHRVLRPGGVLVGYDLVNAPIARAIHRLDGSPHKLYRSAEFAQQLAESGFERPAVQPALRGQLIRFKAERSAAGSAGLPIGHQDGAGEASGSSSAAGRRLDVGLGTAMRLPCAY